MNDLWGGVKKDMKPEYASETQKQKADTKERFEVGEIWKAKFKGKEQDVLIVGVGEGFCSIVLLENDLKKKKTEEGSMIVTNGDGGIMEGGFTFYGAGIWTEDHYFCYPKKVFYQYFDEMVCRKGEITSYQKKKIQTKLLIQFGMAEDLHRVYAELEKQIEERKKCEKQLSELMEMLAKRNKEKEEGTE